jgi:predicted nucleic-acid-binding protein
MIGIDTNLLVRYITQDGKESAVFSDFLLAQVAREHDAVPVATLDKKASRSDDFVLVETA